jgi:hypothetical protein
MATKEITMYYVECDNCKESLFENDEYSCYTDEISAKDVAMDIDGSVINHEGKDYCSSCAKFNDDDAIIIDITRFKQSN